MRGSRRGGGSPRGRPSPRGPARPPREGAPAPILESAPAVLPAAFPEGIRVAVFGRAHGVRGEVRLKAFTQDPLAIADYAPLRLEDGRTIVIEALRLAPGAAPDLLIARVAGVTDRNAAEALARKALFAPRERVASAQGEDPDSFLVADLIGLAVEDEAGMPVGRIVAVPDFGAGDLIEIAPAAGGPTIYLPFREAFVPVVDIAGGRVVVRGAEEMMRPARPDEEPPELDEPPESAP